MTVSVRDCSLPYISLPYISNIHVSCLLGICLGYVLEDCTLQTLSGEKNGKLIGQIVLYQVKSLRKRNTSYGHRLLRSL